MVWAGGELGTTGGELGTTGGELGTKGAGLLAAGGDTGGGDTGWGVSTEGNLIGLLGSRAWERGGSSCGTNVSFNLLQEHVDDVGGCYTQHQYKHIIV